MMGKTVGVPGNDKKISWEGEQLKIALKAFKDAVEKYIQTEEFKTVFKELKVKVFEPGLLTNLQESIFPDEKVLNVDTLFSLRKQLKKSSNHVTYTSFIQ